MNDIQYGVLLWLIYGIWIDSLPVILANAVTLLLQRVIALKIRMQWKFPQLEHESATEIANSMKQPHWLRSLENHLIKSVRSSGRTDLRYDFCLALASAMAMALSG